MLHVHNSNMEWEHIYCILDIWCTSSEISIGLPYIRPQLFWWLWPQHCATLVRNLPTSILVRAAVTLLTFPYSTSDSETPTISDSTSDNEKPPISWVLIGRHLVFCWLTSPPCCNLSQLFWRYYRFTYIERCRYRFFPFPRCLTDSSCMVEAV